MILDGWSAIGGTILYGTSNETSCFLMTQNAQEGIWPLVLYPSGRVEVVFQYLALRSPFDDIAARNELRLRLNKVQEVDLPCAKLELRPGFDLSVLANALNRETIADTLGWFYGHVKLASSAE